MSLWGRLAGSNVYCVSTDPPDLCPKAEPQEQRGLTLHTLASRLQKPKKKKKLNHIWLHVTSLAISFPQCYVTFMFEFFKLYLSALPSPSAVSSPEHSLSLFWPPLSCYNNRNKRGSEMKLALESIRNWNFLFRNQKTRNLRGYFWKWLLNILVKIADKQLESWVKL
jgi:hypothetical protein